MAHRSASYTRDTMACGWSLLFAVIQVFSLLTSFYAHSSNFNETRDNSSVTPRVRKTSNQWTLYRYNPFFRNHNSYLPRYKNNPFLRDLLRLNPTQPTQLSEPNYRFLEYNNTNASSTTKPPRKDRSLPLSTEKIETSFSPNVTSTVVHDSQDAIPSATLATLSILSESTRPSARLCENYGWHFDNLLSSENKVYNRGFVDGDRSLDHRELYYTDRGGGGCKKNVKAVSGGITVEDGFSHVVALGTQNQDAKFSFRCGGAIIAVEWVLTVAHCTHGVDGGVTVALVGTHRLSDSSADTIRIKRTIRHPSYKPPALYADIALLELETGVTFSVNLRPACLPLNDEVSEPFASVCGWGATEFDGDESDSLQKASLLILDNVECQKKHNHSIAAPNGVTPSMICAVSFRGARLQDTCRGDSGGPLQTVHPVWNCLNQIVGITSFGAACAFVDTPGVYTRVSYYLEWIEDTLWPNGTTQLPDDYDSST